MWFSRHVSRLKSSDVQCNFSASLAQFSLSVSFCSASSVGEGSLAFNACA
jgi:hypothetical protein